MGKWSEKELQRVDELTPEDAAAMKAQETFVVRAQHKITQMMRHKNISQAEMARRLGVSEARVSLMFSNDKNFTLRTIARLLHAMGEEAALTTTRELNEQTETGEKPVVPGGWHVQPDRSPIEVVEPFEIDDWVDVDRWAAQSQIFSPRRPASRPH